MGNLTRRGFLKGSTLCLTALGGLRLGLHADPARAAWSGDRFLVYVYLRGGIDGLNMVCPIAGPDRVPYEQRRPNIHLRTTGATAALPLGASSFGLNFAATGLHELYGQGKLAIVHGTGFPPGQITRSHFDAQDYMEHGTPGSSSIGTGWLARHLASAGQVPDAAMIPAFSAGSNAPASLLGRRDAMVLDDPNSYHPNANNGNVDGVPRYKLSTLMTLQNLYQGTGDLDRAGAGATETVELVDTLNIASYTPSPGANYPSTGVAATLGNQAKLIANIAKRGLGLQVATLDYGGWDTHENQGDGTQADLNQNQYAARLAGLSQTLHALYTDLAGSGMANRMVVVVHSEFGRRVRENANRGTDHGSANPMLVLGGRIRGGQLYGSFGGLQDGQLFQNEDVATTTDFRRVLSEVVTGHLGSTALGSVFPGYAYPGPLGLLPGDPIFAASFD
ncbi:DUF1501 domain-containing protein [Dokdonella koreensis]|uniref:DUF1501 domain-containing protein n=1 Tax=Dokdonella koreensis DS-123 TaxID=1300342 RepID=A0A160DU71_9GAMM|nr:DUF1501 domain-containing protein [Dokdonella koreensis]ANB17213.1 Hypothetical protein I596_1183 [Dokdonella koreensis DS-123]